MWLESTIKADESPWKKLRGRIKTKEQVDIEKSSMKRESMMPTNIFSFDHKPPQVAYLDPSFCVNVLIEKAKFHTQCATYSEKLEEQGTILLLSNLGLNEIWFVLLCFQAIEILKRQGAESPKKHGSGF